MGVLIRKGIPYGGSIPQVQSDWDESSVSSAAYILNKPTALSDFTNDLNFITKTVNDLTNYYTKTQVDEFIDLIPKFKIEVVSSLLVVTDPNETTVYLVPSSDPESSNIYTEYVYVIDETTHTGEFEKIGVQDVDLTDYVRKSELPGLIKNDGTIDPNKYFPDKDVLYRNAPKTWYGMPIFGGNNFWTDGTNMYYSDGHINKVWDKSTNMWINKIWHGTEELEGMDIFMDGDTVYYWGQAGSLVLDKETDTWEYIDWDGLYSWGRNVWSDGINLYAANHDANEYKIFDSSTRTWVDIEWDGLPSNGFDGENVWTDGTNYYLSEEYDQKVFNFATRTLTDKTWGGDFSPVGMYIWRDGDHIYYSYEDTQKELNQTSGEWENKVWYDKDSMTVMERFNGYNIWSDGQDIYYSAANPYWEEEVSGQRKLNRETSIWEEIQWEGMAAFNGRFIWSDGEHIYYSDDNIQYILNPHTSTWIEYDVWTDRYGVRFHPKGVYIWTDGTDIYYSYGSYQCVLNKETKQWNSKSWSGLSDFYASGIWTDGEHIYYSYGNTQKELDISTSSWTTKTWNGLSSFTGGSIWKLGDDIYYSSNSEQYVLDKSTSTWSEVTWEGIDPYNFNGIYIWTTKDKAFYSYGPVQKVLDISTHTWVDITWDNLFEGDCIWTDGDSIFYSFASFQYEFSSSLASSSSPGLVKVDGKTIWVDKDGTLHINIASTSTLGLVKPDGTSIIADPDGTIHAYIDTSNLLQKSSTSGFVRNDGSIDENKYIPKRDYTYEETWIYKYEEQRTLYNTSFWSDGVDAYYSDGNTQLKFNNDTQTWSTQTWTGLTNFNGDKIWTDGNNIYYSNGSSQYVLNKATDTWTAKTWSYIPNYFYPSNVWTDGENTYYSYNASHYVLDKNNNRWVEKVWYYSGSGDLPEIDGAGIWTDGENIYYSSYSTHLILNKATNTWSDKTWNIDPEAGYIWNAGDNVYYSNDTDQYVLNKTTGTWVTQTWEGITDFYGNSVWKSNDNYYTYHDYEDEEEYHSNSLMMLERNPVKILLSDGTEDLNTYATIDNLDDYALKSRLRGLIKNDGSIDTNNYIPKRRPVYGDTWVFKYDETTHSQLEGLYYWTDGTDTYYSESTIQLKFNKSTYQWETKTWTGLTDFNGDNIWTDGDNIYYSGGTYYDQYVLNKETSTWVEKTWGNIDFYGRYIWTDGIDIYCSYDGNHYVLNPTDKTWVRKTWHYSDGESLPDISGDLIWTDGDDIYYSDGYSTNLILDRATSTWSDITWNIDFDGNGGPTNIWFDGNNAYYSYNSDQYVLNKNTKTWVAKTWNGIKDSDFCGYDIWTDGNNFYYYAHMYEIEGVVYIYPLLALEPNVPLLLRSDGTEDPNTYLTSSALTNYVQKSSTSGLIKNDGTIDTSTYLSIDEKFITKTWNGATPSDTRYIWTDGENIYYSSGTVHKVLNKATSTWEDKTWTGLPSSVGANVFWSDGENVYYSSGSTQKVLNKSTSTWSDKTWSGLTSFSGGYVWSDGTTIYYSEASTAQKVLDKATSTWSDKTWTDFGTVLPYGNNVWSDGENIYYSMGNIQKIYDKTTTQWTNKTWNGYTMLTGANIWNDGDKVYFSSGTNQKVLDKTTSTWNDIVWEDNIPSYGQYVWSDGNKIYYSQNSDQFELQKNPLDSKQNISLTSPLTIGATQYTTVEGVLAGLVTQLNSLLFYIEQQITLSTSAATTATFTDSSITTDSFIEVATSEWGLVPSDVTVTTGVVTVTFPTADTVRTIRARVYVR